MASQTPPRVEVVELKHLPNAGSLRALADVQSCKFLRIPAAYLKVGIADIGTRRRLNVPFFQADPVRNPSGALRPQTIRCVAKICVGGDFVLDVRIEQEASGPVLVIKRQAYDSVLNRQEDITLSLPLLAALYVELGRRYVTEQARQRSWGRN